MPTPSASSRNCRCRSRSRCPTRSRRWRWPHGYAMVTRKPQVVMVHTIAGTANATGGLINARSNNVPMLFSAGRTPLTETGLQGLAQRRHPLGAGVRRPGQHGARVGEVGLRAALRRRPRRRRRPRPGDHGRASPQGPVYLTLPREVLAEEIADLQLLRSPAHAARTVAMATPESIKRSRPAAGEGEEPARHHLARSAATRRPCRC